MLSPRWFGVGSADSAEPDVDARATNQALVDDDARLLVVCCSQSDNLSELLAQIHACSAGAPLIGCATAGEIATSGPAQAVVVAVFGSDGFKIGTAAAIAVSNDLGRRECAASTIRRWSACR
jgi:hypothetical protein